jgi:nicotinamidase-related amidase
MHPRIARREDAFLLVVDLQEPLLRGVADPDGLLKNVGILIDAARTLGLPILATEQYPERFGPTVEAVQSRWGEVEPVGKLRFSSCGCDAIQSSLQSSGRRTAILCGVETHVCVNQTAHDLLNEGFTVHVPADAVSCRTPANHEMGLGKIRDSGAILTSTEMVVFEMLREAGTPEFKGLLPLFK